MTATESSLLQQMQENEYSQGMIVTTLQILRFIRHFE